MKGLGLEYYEMADFWRQAPDEDCKEWGFEWMKGSGQDLKSMPKMWQNYKSVHKFLYRTDEYYKQFLQLNPHKEQKHLKITASWQAIKCVLDKVQRLSQSQFPSRVSYATINEHKEKVTKDITIDKISK